ncbi:uncharacterized protein [Misgurnus anguillicaudatus]|uniref:uncharacterized protein isoform X3 n=1 Tax=Misgurnus anguillicaudatus TaxID=75329 RepID=UPI003CCF5831
MGQKGCHFSLYYFSPVQANLALSPTILLSPPKSPEAKQSPTNSNPSSPSSSLRSTPQPAQLSCEDEMPVSFEQPAEGNLLLSINKSRARLFKRRLPTRHHRKSASEDTKSYEKDESSCQAESLRQNGGEEVTLSGPLPEDDKDKMASSHVTNDPEPEEQDKDRMENRDAVEENERTEITQTGNQQEVPEEVTSDEHQPSEEQHDNTEDDQIEMKENKELIDTEKDPEEK